MATIDPDYPQTTEIAPVTKQSIKRKILYVVHRYAPYPGGSENYVRDMAEATYHKGHTVAVFSGEHMGPLNGVFVTSDPEILKAPWDLIVVHGGDVSVQNYVLNQADKLGGPVLYLLILPSHSPVCVGGMHRSKYVGCSTIADWRHVQSYQVQSKMVRVRHGINVHSSIGTKGFRERNGITTKYMFMSAGGFWPNKGFDELIDTFNSAGRTDTTLLLTGYDNRNGLFPKETEFVKPLLLDKRADMLSALRSSDLYILNSTSEGFGLVLLEAMLNGVPWIARNIAGAETMQEFGKVYTSQDQLKKYIQGFAGESIATIETAQQYVISSHQITHTVEDILRVIA